MTNMIANGGWSTPEITSVGKPATNDLDGPAGINSLVSSLKGVSFPSEVIVGSSWNTDLAQRFGTAFGAEAAANHVVGLYAPGMNIHRPPSPVVTLSITARTVCCPAKWALPWCRAWTVRACTPTSSTLP